MRVPGASGKELSTSEPQFPCVGTWLLPIVCWWEGLAWVRREPSRKDPHGPERHRGPLSWYLLLNRAGGWRQLLIMTQLMSVN